MTKQMDTILLGAKWIGYALALLLLIVGAYRAGAGEDYQLWIIVGAGLGTLTLLVLR